MNWWQRPTRTFAAIDDCQEFRVWFWASSHLVVSCRRSNFKEHSQDLLNESDQPCLQIDISKGLYFALDIKVSFSQETTKSNSVIVPFCWKSISSSFSSFWRNSFIHLTGFPRVHSCISPLSPAQVKGKNPAIATTFRSWKEKTREFQTQGGVQVCYKILKDILKYCIASSDLAQVAKILVSSNFWPAHDLATHRLQHQSWAKRCSQH